MSVLERVARALEDGRRAEAAAWQPVLSGDPAAIAVVLSVAAQRAALLGLGSG